MRVSLKLVFMFHNILIGSIGYVVAQNLIELTTTDLAIGHGRSVCPGNVVFTCITRGTSVVAWISEEYIGTGNAQLQFAAMADSVGTVRRSRRGSTFANLSHGFTENGVQVLISKLHISVEPNSPNASVSCVHVENNTERSMNFQVIADPGLPQDLVAIQIENPKSNYCIVTASWRHPVNLVNENLIRNYTIFANGTNLSNDTIVSRISENNTIISTVLSVPGCFAHSISVRPDNVCGRSGPQTSPFMLDPATRHIVPEGTPCNCSNGDSSSRSKNNAGPFNYNEIIMTVMAMSSVLLMMTT